MRSNVFVTLAAMLLAATYFLVLRIQPDEQGELSRCIPKNALVYFEQLNGMDIWSKFSSSKLVEKIESIDFVNVAKETGAAEETIETIKSLSIAAKLIGENSLYLALFGKRFALAILPPLATSSGRGGGLEDLLSENLVIVATPENPAKILKNVSMILAGSKGDEALSSSQYGRHIILRVINNKKEFSLVMLDSFLLISQNERQLRLCIDTFDGEYPSFSENDGFLALKNSFPSPDSALVLSLKNARENLPALLIDHDLPFVLVQTETFIKEINEVSYGAKRNNSAIIEKILVCRKINGDPSQEDPIVKPTKPSRLNLTTPDPMFYLWSNSFDLQQVLYSAESVDIGISEITGDIADLGTSVEKVSDYRDIFGKEITVIAEPAAESDPLPIPLALILIPVGNQEVVLKGALEGLLETYNIPTKTEEYGPAWFVYWNQSPQDGLVPLYGFWGELFFLGNSLTLLHKVIDMNSRDLSLLDIERVKNISSGLTKESNTVLYSNNGQLIDIIKNILNALGTVIGIEDRAFAVKARLVINKVFMPLLDWAKMYGSSSVTNCTVTQEMVTLDIITAIADHP